MVMMRVSALFNSAIMHTRSCDQKLVVYKHTRPLNVAYNTRHKTEDYWNSVDTWELYAE